MAHPDALTILIDGDGSFGMTNMDLQTVKRQGRHVDEWCSCWRIWKVQTPHKDGNHERCQAGGDTSSHELFKQEEFGNNLLAQAANGLDLAAAFLRGPLHQCNSSN